MALTLESLPVELIAGIMEQLDLESLITVSTFAQHEGWQSTFSACCDPYSFRTSRTVYITSPPTFLSILGDARFCRTFYQANTRTV